MLIELTEQQVRDLFKLKRYFQDYLGVHYFSGVPYKHLQCPSFFNEVIEYAIWYWQRYEEGKKKYKDKFQNWVPFDFMKESREELPNDYNNLMIADIKETVKQNNKEIWEGWMAANRKKKEERLLREKEERKKEKKKKERNDNGRTVCTT